MQISAVFGRFLSQCWLDWVLVFCPVSGILRQDLPTALQKEDAKSKGWCIEQQSNKHLQALRIHILECQAAILKTDYMNIILIWRTSHQNQQNWGNMYANWILIIDGAPPFKNITQKCSVYLKDKFYILYDKSGSSLKAGSI